MTGLLASYTVPGQPERLVALKRREVTELISEELRRMDPDEVYESTVKSLVGPPESRRPTTKERAATKRTTRSRQRRGRPRSGRQEERGRPPWLTSVVTVSSYRAGRGRRRQLG